MSQPRDAHSFPWWVTLADVCSIGLAALALVVSVTGGYRGRVAGVLVSLTSPFRVLVIAAVVTVARHLAVPRPNLVVRLRDAVGGTLARAGRRVREPRAADFGTRGSLWVEMLAMSGLMVAATVVMLYPFARHLDRVSDLYDPLFSVWRVAWVAHQLPRDPLHLYDANMFWPERYTLAYSDGMPLTGAAAAPFIWLGAPPGIVCNVFVLASFVLCGLTMYLLVRSLVGSVLPAVVSGTAFAFYPFRFEHFLHMELLSAFWMPLALWSLHKTMTGPAGRQWRFGLLTGAAVAAQYLSGMYFGVFLASFMLVVWGVLALARRGLGIGLRPLVAGGLLAAVLILPSLEPYMHVRNAVGERSRDEVKTYSAQPSDYLAVEHPGRTVGGCNERQVFPGFLIVVLALGALWPPWSAVRMAYLAGLAFAFDLSLGMNGITHPFLYEWFLPFRGLRAPARSAMLVGLALAVLAGFGAARLQGVLRRRRWQAVLTVILCGVILAEPRPTLDAMPLPRVSPVYDWFDGRPTSTIVELPVWLPTGARYLFNSTSHWQRMVNGFSGAIPASYRPFHVAMRTFPDEASMEVLRARGVAYAVMHEEIYGTLHYREMIGKVERSLSLRLVHTASDGTFESRIYQILR